MGHIKVHYKLDDNELHAMIQLPERVEGVFCWNGDEYILESGSNCMVIE